MSQEVDKWLGSMGYNPNILHLLVGCPAPRLVLLAGAYQRSNRDHLDWWLIYTREKKQKGFGKTLNPWVFLKQTLRESILLPFPFHQAAFPKKNRVSRVATTNQVTSSCKPSCFNFHICKAAWHQGALDKLAVKVFTSGAALARWGSRVIAADPHGGIHCFKVHGLVVFHPSHFEEILPSWVINISHLGKRKIIFKYAIFGGIC